MFKTEEKLVEMFLSAATDPGLPWGSGHVLVTEFDYGRGRTDILSVSENGTVLAFEAKLSRWKDALYQAYRNTCFAHKSYIVLPEMPIARREYIRESVEHFNVGFCMVSMGGIEVIHDPDLCSPLQPVLTEQAISLGNVIRKH